MCINNNMVNRYAVYATLVAATCACQEMLSTAFHTCVWSESVKAQHCDRQWDVLRCAGACSDMLKLSDVFLYW